MKWSQLSAVLSLTLLLQGCYTANMLELDGLKPAEVTFPVDVQSMVVISRIDLDSAYKVSYVAKGIAAQFNRDSLMSKQAVLGCSDGLLESPRFDLFNPVIKRTLDEEFSGSSTKIPWDAVRSIAGDPPVDAVLSLEDATIDDTIRSVIEDGWRTYYYFVYVKSFWRMYRLSDFQSKEFHFADTVSFLLASPNDFLSVADNRIKCISEAMYEAGIQTSRRLAPWWTVLERFYYAFGPTNFLKGAEYLRKGQYTESAQIWRPFTESRQKPVAAKACFNMALTCEMANNIPAAREWLTKAGQLGLPWYFVKDYQDKLNGRLTETARLDQQMR